MIEINLVPDVKMELLRTERLRTTMISISILVAGVAAGLAVLMGMYVFGAQAFLKGNAETTITKESDNLKAVNGLATALTIQNQLSKISETHASNPVNSRMLDMLNIVKETNGHDVLVTKISVDSENKEISIEGNSPKGYVAYEAFKKTINNTKFKYYDEAEKKLVTKPIAQQISDGERRYGTDSNNVTVLRFTVRFTYADKLFDRAAINAQFVKPENSNVTDSTIEVTKDALSAPTTPNGNGEGR